jgi:hypothetical protein
LDENEVISAAVAYKDILGLRREDTTPYKNHQAKDTTTTT